MPMDMQQEAFDALTAPYRYELLVHCYRILGSVEDAEDGLQETLLRAWRHQHNLNNRAAARAWLYRIATNVSLDMLRSRKVRSLPHLLYPAADPQADLPAPLEERAWLDPLPEFYLADLQPNPEQQQQAAEAVSLAFLAVLQHLPGRQRAVLLLRDVLDWKASEVASALEMSVAAVNSALQRARASLKQHGAALLAEDQPAAEDPDLALLLTRYLEAWEAADLPGLMALIHADAKMTMPPLPVWYHGREAIGHFLERFVFARVQAGDFQLRRTNANNRPAFAVYQRHASAPQSLVALHILTIGDGKIVHLDDYLALDHGLFARLLRTNSR